MAQQALVASEGENLGRLTTDTKSGKYSYWGGLSSLSVLALTANAQPRYHHGGHRHHSSNNWGWVAPALISGAVVYAATRPPVVQQPVVVQPQVPYGYHYENILDANCNCYRTVLVPN